GCNIDGEDDSYDFGSGAGFYVDATTEKWKNNYRMYSYVTEELLSVVNANFPTQPDRISIFGHSMGGHGALICALKNPGLYRSVSAFAPICNPTKCPWGDKAFSGYLGADRESWKSYDACELVKSYNGPPMQILVDQGKKDNFYVDKQLLPENLVAACTESKMEVVMRMQEVGEIRVIILYQQHFINSTVSTSTVSSAMFQQHCINSTVPTALYNQC
ncbi:S-formylglutathione hydrolase, partial [Apostichopus japonicus]